MRIAFFSLLLLIPLSVEADETDFDVKSVGTLVKHDVGDFYTVDFKLGRLTAGQSGMVNLTLRNPYDVNIDFKEASLQCSCIDFRATENSIPANGSTSVQVRLKTPLRQKSPQTISQIGLTRVDDRPGSIIKIRMKYEVAGLLAMSGQMAVLEIPKNETVGELRIGFIISDPVEFENLVVTASDSLRDVVFELEQKNQKGFVVATVPRSLVERGSISGEVVIKDPVTGKHDGFYCTVKITDSLKISPRILRFRTDGINPDQLVAHAVIRFALVKPPEPTSTDEAADKNPMETVTILGVLKGQAVEISKKPIGHRCIRLRISIAKERISEIRDGQQEVDLDLTIWDGKQSHELKVGTLFID